MWTWTAIDADSNLCASWLLGSRSAADAAALIGYPDPAHVSTSHVERQNLS